jgi:hypothetical protein
MLHLNAENEDEPYTLIDLYKLLSDDENVRKSFVEKVDSDLDEPNMKKVLERYDTVDSNDFAAVRRRIQPLAVNTDMASLADLFEGHEVDQAVDDGKIILADTKSFDTDAERKAFKRAVVSRVLLAGNNRDTDERFFVCVDDN